MNTWISTFAVDSPRFRATALDDRANAINLRRVASVVGLLCVLFVMSDHDWLISRYDGFSETSDFMSQVSSDGNLLRRAAIFLLGAVSAVAIFRRGGYLLRIRGVMAMLIVAAVAWCAASWLWAVEPGIAARRLIASGCIAAAAVASARWLTPRELAAVALAGSTSFLVLGGLVEIGLGTWHPWRADYRFAGTLHPNNQGLNCALLIMAAVELARLSPRWRLAFCGMALIGLIGLWLTKSRTPLAALVGAEVVFWFLVSSWKTKLISALAAVWIACAGLLIIGPTVVEHAFDVAMLGRNDDEQVNSLTGRVPLWEELSNSVASRPLTGYGFNSFWTSDRIDEISESQSWAIAVAHSAYLDLTLGIGLIGTTLWVVVVLTGLIKAAYFTSLTLPEHSNESANDNRMGDGFGFIGVLLAFMLLHGVLESAFANPGFVPLVAMSGLAMAAFVTTNRQFPMGQQSENTQTR